MKITDMCSKSVCEFDHYDNESRLAKMEEVTYIIASTKSKIQSSKSPDTKQTKSFAEVAKHIK